VNQTIWTSGMVWSITNWVANRCPQRVTTGSNAVSKHMLHSNISAAGKRCANFGTFRFFRCDVSVF
jgi:hypothetical protein